MNNKETIREQIQARKNTEIKKVKEDINNWIDCIREDYDVETTRVESSNGEYTRELRIREYRGRRP